MDGVAEAPQIVMVEDNMGDVTLLREAFAEIRQPVRLDIFTDPEDALRYFREKVISQDVPPPDLVLLDLHLPKVDGRQLLRFLHDNEIFRKIPVFVLTTDPRCGTNDPTFDVPPEICLQKPTSWDDQIKLAERLWQTMSLRA